jgi:hypothetical protein
MNGASVARVLALLLVASACEQAQPSGGEAGDAGQPRMGEGDADTEAPPSKGFQAPEWPSPSDTPPAGMACADMTGAQCLLATGCVLEAVPRADPGYVCREAKGPCEGGVAQFPALTFQADCKARPGCRYVAAECFCPPAQTRVRSTSPVAMNCTCGGGSPHRCVAAADTPSASSTATGSAAGNCPCPQNDLLCQMRCRRQH